MEFTTEEKNEVRELFELPLEQLDGETFKKMLRALRARYHPDNFEKFGDDAVRQMAKERFQRLERIAAKITDWMAQRQPAKSEPAQAPDPVFDPRARFAYREMKIELRTADKDLKYHLFGAFYRWLKMGDKFKIPEARNAFIIADEDYLGRSIGFLESIRLYLTFGEDDPVDAVVQWLYAKIAGRADAVLIEGESLPVEYDALLRAVKKRSLRLLQPSD